MFVGWRPPQPMTRKLKNLSSTPRHFQHANGGQETVSRICSGCFSLIFVRSTLSFYKYPSDITGIQYSSFPHSFTKENCSHHSNSKGNSVGALVRRVLSHQCGPGWIPRPNILLLVLYSSPGYSGLPCKHVQTFQEKICQQTQIHCHKHVAGDGF